LKTHFVGQTETSRKAGFAECMDTEEMLEDWLRWMQREKYIPTYD